MKVRFVFPMLMLAGFAVAQGGRRMQALRADLNLTSDQQAQARAIFKEGARQNKDAAAKLRADRVAMAAAVKSGDSVQIDKLAQESGQLQAQVATSRAKSLAKFYALLTPEQKSKADARMDGLMQPGLRRPRK